jgi:hypothetical protein
MNQLAAASNRVHFAQQIPMKNLLATFLLAATGAASAEITLPAALDRARFRETLEKSPFILETKVTDEPKVEKVNPFKDLYIRGIGKADGKDYVLIQRLGEERTMRFFGGEEGEDSMLVKAVTIGATFRETKVVLEKGSETGEVGFKEEAISAPPQVAQMRPPTAPPQFGNQARPMTSGGNGRGVSPQTNPVVPRPQFTPSIQLPKPPGSMNVAPANKPGTPIRQTDPNRRIRTPIISN